MMASPQRRGFLRGLVTLPLIGGGVTLIGEPTAVAQPITCGLLEAYAEWLANEQIELCVDRHLNFGWDVDNPPVRGTPAHRFHYPSGSALRFCASQGCPAPSTRAALVLSTVGCGWRAAA